MLYRFAEGKVFAYDYPSGTLDANQIRLLALTPDGTLLWRNCPTSCVRSSSPCVLRLLDAFPACLLKNAGSPGSRASCFRACLGSQTARDTTVPRQHGTLVVAFPLPQQGRHPEFGYFRGSIPCLHFPLSTLHRRSYERRRMTRGRYGWLDLLTYDSFIHCNLPVYRGGLRQSVLDGDELRRI